MSGRFIKYLFEKRGKEVLVQIFLVFLAACLGGAISSSIASENSEIITAVFLILSFATIILVLFFAELVNWNRCHEKNRVGEIDKYEVADEFRKINEKLTQLKEIIENKK